MKKKHPVAVIGAGVVGLTVAARLAQQFEVTVIAASLEPGTSLVAGAFWHPFPLDIDPQLRALSLESYEHYRHVSIDPSTGVRWGRLLELHEQEGFHAPDWHDDVDDFQIVHVSVPEAGAGVECSIPLIQPSVYLQFLRGEILACGGSLEQRTLRSLDELAFDVIVNCSGLGAARLVRDELLRPVRGQVEVVALSEEPVHDVILYDPKPMVGEGRRAAYLVKRSAGIWILGGTVQESDELLPNDEDRAGIFARCTALFAPLRNAKLIQSIVGLRPVRPKLRLEAEAQGEKLIVHNYGHGGSGYTVAPACAEIVLQKILKVLS